MVSVSEKRALYNQVKIETKIQENLPEIKVSETEMQQVFLNLINNALDVMEKQGGILRIIAELKNGKILIKVSDNGPGILKENISRIFDPFFTTKPVGKGTGLGLSTCYGIIKNMKGEILVDSKIGMGTTFKIYLPT